MEPAKLAALYLEAYFVMTGTRLAKLEDIPSLTYLFFSEMQPDHLAHPVVLHYKRKGWSLRRISAHLGITGGKIKIIFKLHGF